MSAVKTPSKSPLFSPTPKTKNNSAKSSLPFSPTHFIPHRHFTIQKLFTSFSPHFS
jgi:hypothetical protein